MIVKEEIKGSKLWSVPLGGLFKHGDRFLLKLTGFALKLIYDEEKPNV